MKTKDQKYKEGVERNIQNLISVAISNSLTYNWFYPSRLYSQLGIRSGDLSFDEKICNKAKSLMDKSGLKIRF